AAGATVARELAKAGSRVTVLEAGHEFRPFESDLARLTRLRASRLFFDERLITALFRPMRIAMGADHMPIAYGVATGGTTTLTAGNGLRVNGALEDVGLDLGPEFDELEAALPLSMDHVGRWRPSTRALYEACDELGLGPQVMPKLVDFSRCRRCGHCVLGCRYGAKWDSRRFLDEAVSNGATLTTGSRVEALAWDGGGATGVVVRRRRRRELIPADLIFLAAGGLGTPGILERSGIATERRLFVDPVLCVAGPSHGARQDSEIPMPFFVERRHYVISPYFDYLSFFFDARWRRPGADILPLMIKLADSEQGSVSSGRVRKGLTASDKRSLREAVELCRRILGRTGIAERDIFLGTVNAGHPGGTLPLTTEAAHTLHDPRLPQNVYVADASLLPKSLGKPPSLTIMALALRVARTARTAA
ncbi:MAG TPA: GMC family oxidoreductase N-terminal domain-containing protein, partial [Thermoleophilia bacterium]|nr:GMC family oxidoreductase N-terminal domain-containing protein [Thermoleophilia bacterium]